VLGNLSFSLYRRGGTQLAVSCDGVLSNRRKAALPLSHDIEADDSSKTTVFLQFEGNDEA
jgi:hypothetical protein